MSNGGGDLQGVRDTATRLLEEMNKFVENALRALEHVEAASEPQREVLIRSAENELAAARNSHGSFNLVVAQIRGIIMSHRTY